LSLLTSHQMHTPWRITLEKVRSCAHALPWVTSFNSFRVLISLNCLLSRGLKHYLKMTLKWPLRKCSQSCGLIFIYSHLDGLTRMQLCITAGCATAKRLSSFPLDITWDPRKLSSSFLPTGILRSLSAHWGFLLIIILHLFVYELLNFQL
jgi:hypothetical protein